MSAKKEEVRGKDAIRVAGKIVSSFVSCNQLAGDDIPKLLEEVYAVVTGLGTDPKLSAVSEPAAPVAASVTPDYIICLEDGKKLKMLKRYLRNHYDLSPEEYRRKWGLPADYPMTAPNYSKHRSSLAKDIGLGTKAVSKQRRKSVRKTKAAARRRAPVER